MGISLLSFAVYYLTPQKLSVPLFRHVEISFFCRMVNQDVNGLQIYELDHSHKGVVTRQENTHVNPNAQQQNARQSTEQTQTKTTPARSSPW